MNAWQFMGEHPFVTALIVLAIFAIVKYLLRSINVAVRGWPPPHLDADGSFREEDEKDEVA